MQPVAFLTGAGGAIGSACAAALAADGFAVVASDLDPVAVGRATEGLADAEGISLDVADRPAVEDALVAVLERRGRLDVLVNLAGVARNQVVHKIVDEDFDLVMDSHLRGTLNTMRAALPVMKRAGRGRVINFSSVAVRGSLGGGAYGAAKGAIEALSRSAAIEVARSGITVNCVAPGLVGAGLFLTTPPEYQRERIEGVPMGRAGSVEEVAAAVCFFASPGASYVTGQTLFVCGGLTIGI